IRVLSFKPLPNLHIRRGKDLTRNKRPKAVNKVVARLPKSALSAAPTPTHFNSKLESPPFQSHNTNQLFLFRLSPLAATRGGVIELYA
ncbi:hypothetical protein CGJ27_25465, partial [Vibrio parahaemolyticus]